MGYYIPLVIPKVNLYLPQDTGQLRLKLRKTLPRSIKAYRLYLALFEDMVGLPTRHRSVEAFLEEFSFSKLTQKGFGPVACAALTGDPELVRGLVLAKAPLHTRTVATQEMLYQGDATPLHLAVWFKSHDLQMLQMLLELRANPNATTIKSVPPLNFCRSAAAVELLVQYGAGVNFQGSDVSCMCPLLGAAAVAAPFEVHQKLLDLRADVSGGRGGIGDLSPLCALAFSGDSPANLESALLLLDRRADINHVCRPQGIFKVFELLTRACCWFRCEPYELAMVFSNITSTPLGCCSMLDNEGLLTLLLSASADPEIKNSRGYRPIDLARSDRIRDIFQDCRPYVLDLEQSFGLVSEPL